MRERHGRQKPWEQEAADHVRTIKENMVAQRAMLSEKLGTNLAFCPHEIACESAVVLEDYGSTAHKTIKHLSLKTEKEAAGGERGKTSAGAAGRGSQTTPPSTCSRG
jgi:hypothetical protein